MEASGDRWKEHVDCSHQCSLLFLPVPLWAAPAGSRIDSPSEVTRKTLSDFSPLQARGLLVLKSGHRVFGSSPHPSAPGGVARPYPPSFERFMCISCFWSSSSDRMSAQRRSSLTRLSCNSSVDKHALCSPSPFTSPPCIKTNRSLSVNFDQERSSEEFLLGLSS